MGLALSLLCDRRTTNVAKSQIGFISFVVQPYFEAIAKFIPHMQYTVDQLNSNKDQWAKHIDEYEKDREENGNE